MYQGCLEMERIRSKQRTKDAGWKGNGEKEENEESLKYLPQKTTMFKLLKGGNHRYVRSNLFKFI